MATIWFMIVAVMVAAYVVLDGFDLGAGAVHLFIAQDRRRAPHDASRHRPGVGRQRSVAAGRRRHAVLRVSAALRVELQRILSAADDGAVAADAARHRHRVPHPHARAGVAAASSTSSSRSRASCWQSSSARRWAMWCAACRSNADGYFFEPLWTNWRVGAQNGILDWYTVMCGVVALVTLGRSRLALSGHEDGRRTAAPRAQSCVMRCGRCRCC